MLKVNGHRRRLLRKNMYRPPHRRHSKALHSKLEKPKEQIQSIEKPKAKKRVNNGYKMSYRYKYYNNPSIVEEDEKTEESNESDS